MAQSKFKTGDRVHWKSLEEEDYGTVQPDSCKSNYAAPEGCVWVKWDSNGYVLHVPEDEIQKVEFTVENCIDFLISQGYSVTSAKEYK